jgi:prophage antirepressor-like protein
MSTPALQTFTFGTQRVRTVLEEDGIKFVAVDVCNALGLTNNREAVAGLDDDEKGVGIADTLGGKQTMVVITESGLYSLVLRSRRPEAKTFKKWVTAEVLPTLRRTGTYSVLPAPFDLPKTFSEALRLLADTHDVAEALKLTVEAQKPSVEFVEHYVQASGTFGIRETAKLLGIGPQDFTRRLQDKRILFRERGQLQPYAEHLADGYFALRTGEANDHAFTQTRFTPRGIEWVRRRLNLPTPPTHSNILQLTA